MADAPQERADEFAAGAASWPGGLDRREFLRLAGASFALAGLTGCARQPRKIVPYVTPPESRPIQDTVFYASAMPVEGFGRGVLVETHLGRPTKIEGNPAHSESLGATDAMTQAAILSLYDPDRSEAPLRAGRSSDWVTFEAEWRELRESLDPAGGAGLALLAEPTTSPTMLREMHRLLDTLPSARWYQHTPLARHDTDGAQLEHDFARADVVFSLGSDFLFDHPASLRYTRGFASRRRVDGGRIRPNRFYALEPTPSVTGAMADHRLPVSPARLPRLLNALASLLGSGATDGGSLAPPERQFLSDLARDLALQAPNVLCIAPATASPEIAAWTLALNRRLGALGRTVRRRSALRSDGDPRAAGTLPDLTEAITRGEVRALVILGANPVYTAPADLGFAAQLARVPFTVHFGGHADETAARTLWHLPESHFLEVWGDLRGFDGSATILQPMIEPLHATRSGAELLHFLSASLHEDGYDLVRETWRGEGPEAEFESAWRSWLNQGVIAGASAAAAEEAPAAGTGGIPELRSPPADETLFLQFLPDPTLGDGRWANNAWLQELPKPLTRLVWGNVVLLPPALGRKLRVENGDHLRLEAAGRSVEGPAWIMPGQADDCVTIHLGHGRERAGSVGNGYGFNAYAVRSSAAPWQDRGLRVVKTGRVEMLVSTQGHFTLVGRDLLRTATPDALGAAPTEPAPSIYPPKPPGRHAWGMSIDLSTCTGCAACVIACQAENNIPVVGKDQVGRGREMHWIRIDRYYLGAEDNPRLLVQPVPCMQCENAPCELVCPVGATVHSTEGLNDMTYNRCVGTRYCSNNCPYKVRRFNFLDFRAPRDSTVHLQENPDVTVRERGVMEKCTYCVQRINAARIAAERDNRPIRDGEVVTACQQACPAEAIVFGDLSDPASRVTRRKAEPGNYALLEELNTRPRTTYLPRVINTAHEPA